MSEKGNWSHWFGYLDWTSTPFDDFLNNPSINDFVVASAAFGEVVGVFVVLGLLTYFKIWKGFWKNWLTTVDHKKIGIMYIVVAFVMMGRGIAEGFVMRMQHASIPVMGGIIEPEHYAQIFSTHGTIMIFFVAMPLLMGLINYVVPLQIGARDMAFPIMNQISLGLTVSGAMLIFVSLFIGKFSTGGWTAYPPYTGIAFSPGVGVDYWILAINLSGIGSLLSAINFAVTIYKLRCPGMNYFRMPIFVWTTLSISIILIYAVPALTVCSILLALDRYLDFHFFTNDLGGNMMQYANLFWMFGHPEVYVLILPAFGVFSEIAATFASKKIYGYRSLVYASVSIAVISFLVWAHHFFTMGQSTSVNVAFGIATMVIAIPTGVKVYAWMATLWRGRIRLSSPMIYLFGFFILFVIGGLTGIILANPSIDYQVHNSMFLVAHIHNVLIPGVLFGMFCGVQYWFPKAFGYMLDEFWGRLSAFFWTSGFIFTFIPLYIVGLLGMPRRSAFYSQTEFSPFMYVSLFGAVLMLSAMGSMTVMFLKSFLNRKKLQVPAGDPWDGRTLEWFTSSPPPAWNFSVIPTVTDRDAFTVAKKNRKPYSISEELEKHYEPIKMPSNTSIGFFLCVLSGVCGFAIVWHIWWLTIVSIVLMVASGLRFSLNPPKETIVSVEELRNADRAWLNLIESTTPVGRLLESSEQNNGLAKLEEV